MYSITNLSKGSVGAGGLVWLRNETKSLYFVNAGIIKAVEEDKLLTCTVDLTPLTDLSSLSNTMNDITDSSTGTAAEADDGSVIVGAVTDIATAANAISTLIAELTIAKSTIDALLDRVALLEGVLSTTEANLGRSIT